MSESRKWSDNEKKAFAEIISSLDKEELLFIYEMTRRKLKAVIEKDTEVRYKFCDRCSRTFPNSATKCVICSSQLREFEVPFDNHLL